jgi:hypothetical protein
LYNVILKNCAVTSSKLRNNIINIVPCNPQKLRSNIIKIAQSHHQTCAMTL